MPFIHETLVANGTTSLGRIVFSKAFLDMILNDHVITLAVNVGGTGYVVGETFDVVGGTPIGAFVARGIVTAESGGVVTAVKYISAGAYSTLPGVTGAATTNASAAGNDDLTVDLTTEVATWTVDRNTYVDDQTDFEWIATSTKAANPATIGMVTVTSGGNDSSELLVASGFDNGQTFTGQPDGSPTGAMHLNLPSQNPELYLSVTDRRANIMARDGNNVQYGGLGLFLPLTNVDASYPFPGMVHGQSTGIAAFSQQYVQNGNGGNNAGVVNPGTFTSVFPAVRYRDNLSSQWLTIAQISGTGGARSMMWPHRQGDNDFQFTHAPQVSGQNTQPFSNGQRGSILGDASGNGSSAGWFVNAASLQALGVPGVSPFGTGLQMSLTVTAHIISSQVGDTQVIGFIDGYENVHGVGLTAFEEIESFASASRYIVFPDTNGADLGQWVAMEIL
ncbi:MAG: hypothetical protein KAI80_08090 [Hyphomicrobiaceae bacterium]|nr:hypothetical protein [Hyphomicrobiaceae bacterium]